MTSMQVTQSVHAVLAVQAKLAAVWFDSGPFGKLRTGSATASGRLSMNGSGWGTDGRRGGGRREKAEIPQGTSE